MNELIRIEKLSFAYEQDIIKNVISSIDLKIMEGEFVTITGRNGAGKSSLGKLINAFIKPNQGDIYIGGLNTKEDKNFWDIKKSVGIVFQNPDNQLLGLSIKEELCFGPSSIGMPQEKIKELVKQGLKISGFETEDGKNSLHLSGGQGQKLSIAATITMEPKILVLDEVTSMLDPFEKSEVFKLLKNLNQEKGVTILNITLDLDEIKIGERIIWMEEGRICFDGGVEDFFVKYPELKPKDQDFKTMASYDQESLGKSSNVTNTSDMSRVRITSDTGGSTNTNKEIISVKNLTYEVSMGKKLKKKILKNISFGINKGEFVLIIGKNGSGKTSLIHHLNGILLKDTNSIKILGDEVSKGNLRVIRKNVAMVFQNPDHQFVRENIFDDMAFSLVAKAYSREDIESRINEIMEILQLDKSLLKRSIFEISEGEKRKVAIGGVLAGDPSIIIFDEPTAGMDFYERKNFQKTLKVLKEDLKKTLIIVSHHMEDFLELADRCIVIDEGSIISDTNVLEGIKAIGGYLKNVQDI